MQKAGFLMTLFICVDLFSGAKLSILHEHKSFVQGVTFDPLNEFAASLSADR